MYYDLCNSLKKEKEASHGTGRFEGMESFFIWQTTRGFLDGDYDFNVPPPNPKEYEKYRDFLVEKCRTFTGYDSNKPTLEDNYEPLHNILSIINLNNNCIKRTLYWSSKKDLIRMLFLKIFKRIDMYDIKDDIYLRVRKRKKE